MNEIILSSACQPVVCGCGSLAASEPFCHTDRVPDFHVMLYVTEGTVYVTEGGVDYEVGAGELLFLKKGIRHLGKREIPRGTKWYYAHFRLDEPEPGFAPFEPDAEPLRADERLSVCVPLPKKLSVPGNESVGQRFAGLAEYCRSGDPLKRMRINGMFCALLTDIALTRYMEKKERTLSERICAWLDEHCTEPFSTARLEHGFFLSYKRMAAVFKQEQGRTMQQYHSERRMMRACYLLKSTVVPVGEVASQLGFDDPLYFSKCFHAFSGMSPRSYRQSARSEY